MLYKNDIVNTINVKSLGVSGAKTTKVDTWVEIGDEEQAPRKVDINISLKVGDVKQFGQVGGTKWEGQLRMWESFGIAPDNIGAKFEKHTKFKRYKEAFDLSFESALAKFKKNNSASEDIGKGIVFWATLNQDNVDLVSLKNSSVVVYRFKGAVEKIKDLALEAKITYSSGTPKLPTIKFEAKDDKQRSRLLVQVRARRDGTYFRTVVEKGDYLDETIGEKIDIPSENQA